MGKSRASAPIAQERVQRSSKKKPRDVQRRTRGSASLPAPADRLGPTISTVLTNDSTFSRSLELSSHDSSGRLFQTWAEQEVTLTAASKRLSGRVPRQK
jgi:hypothetical protein